MTTARRVEFPQDGAARHANGAHLHSVDGAPPPVRQALAKVEDLERRLASSQQECVATQERLEFLANANARLKELVVLRDQDTACGNRLVGPSRKVSDSRLSTGLDVEATEQIEHLLAKRRRYRKGDGIYLAGRSFNALYEICSGSCKTVLLATDGQDQVAGYHLAGEIIGLDGIATDRHECHAIALEDIEVSRLPFDQVENLARRSPQFGHTLHKLLSQENARARTLMVMLGTMRAEQRVAMFLLDLSRRYEERGHSSCELVLRLTRQEIGSYLGLKLETVSRMLSRFQREGLIQVEGRIVKLLDRVSLNRLLDCDA